MSLLNEDKPVVPKKEQMHSFFAGIIGLSLGVILTLIFGILISEEHRYAEERDNQTFYRVLTVDAFSKDLNVVKVTVNIRYDKAKNVTTSSIENIKYMIRHFTAAELCTTENLMIVDKNLRSIKSQHYSVRSVTFYTECAEVGA